MTRANLEGGPDPHGSGVRDPLRSVPALEPGTLRRTMHVDVGPAAAWAVKGRELELAGAARDVRAERSGDSKTTTGVVPERGMVLEREARIAAKFDSNRVLVALEIEPDSPWAETMVGQRAGSGFRRFLEETTPDGPETSLVRQLLEDLPAAALISGYSSLRLARRLGGSPAALTPPTVLDRMTDMCSGWRGGGVAVLSVAAGKGVPVQDTPEAPDLAQQDPDAWHRIPVLEADWMRRRRLVDVRFDVSGDADIWAMFRDTVGEPDGSERVLHEYSVSARVVRSEDGLVLDSITADPRVLPFVECPAAAAEVVALEGMLLRDLPRRVPEALFSVASCTHLNDLLRNIGGIAPVLEAS
jgi:Protein of unknown function (DUF2889)